MTSLAAIQRAMDPRYSVDAEIGTGGAATVYLVTDHRHKRQLAMKLFRPDTADASGRERFLKEVGIIAQLQHPYIVPLIDSGDADGLLYYLMPFVRGMSLRTKLLRTERMSPDEVGALGAQVAIALAYAHEHGIVHRDIKPENILLDGSHPYVADFGIGKDLRQSREHLTQTGVAVGTPAYMPPEQLFGDVALDGRADVYALACVLFEALTGEVPHAAPDVATTAFRRLTEPPPAITAVRSDVPGWLAVAISDALARHPAERPSAAELSDRLVKRDDAARPSVPVSAPRQHPSLIILPFENRSTDADTEYFSDGVTDEVIGDLSKIRSIRVIARAASQTLKGTRQSIGSIGRQFSVQYVLTGTVRRSEQAVRLTAELVDVASESQVWSERFSAALTDVFDLQEALAREVVQALRVKLTPAEDRRLMRAPMDLRAFEMHLRAKQHIGRFDAVNLAAAEELLADALRVAPEHPLLLATQGYAIAQFTNLGSIVGPDVLLRAKERAERAVAADPELAMGHFVLGFVQFRRGDVQAAADGMRRAAELDPSLSEAWFWLGVVRTIAGRPIEAIAALDRVRSVDPFTALPVQAARGWVAGWNGDWNTAVTLQREAVATTPSRAFQMLLSVFGSLAGDASTAAKARIALEQADRESTHTRISRFADCCARGDRAAALAEVNADVVAIAQSDETIPWILGAGYARLEDVAEAVRWARIAVQRGTISWHFYALHNPWFAALRGVREFEDFLAALKPTSDAFRP